MILIHKLKHTEISMTCPTQKKVSVLIKTQKKHISVTDNEHFLVSYLKHICVFLACDR